MDNKKHFLDYLAQIFRIFGITILILAVFACMIGDQAATYSTMFVLGHSGLSVPAVLCMHHRISLRIFYRYIFQKNVTCHTNDPHDTLRHFSGRRICLLIWMVSGQ